MTELSYDLPRLDLGLADLAGAHDLVLCDVWGVVHNGIEFHRDAVDALRRFRSGGGTVILITNAPVPHTQVRQRLERLGVPDDAYDGIATSGDVTIDMIIERGCPPLFGIGPTDEIELYREAGLRGPRRPELVTIERATLAVCVGLDEVRGHPEDYDEILSHLHGRDLEFVCANPDIVVEVGDDLVYCAGAIAERYAAIGGTVIQAGKPFAPIYERARAIAASLRGPTPRDRVLAIGDAMHTDMQGAHEQGFSGLFVTGGIHRAELHPYGSNTAIDDVALGLLLARHGARPGAALPGLRWSS